MAARRSWGLQSPQPIPDGMIEAGIADLLPAAAFVSEIGTNPRSSAARAADFVRPEEWGTVTGTDDDAILHSALAVAKTRKSALVLGSGNYALTTPLVLTSTTNIVIMPGAKLIAGDGFVGAAMVLVGTTSTRADNWRICGGGHINGRNVADVLVDVIYGHKGMVRDLALIGGNTSAFRCGSNSAAAASYQVNIESCSIEYNDVANTSESVGVHFRNATDSRAVGIECIGYRKGFYSERGSISFISCHPWSRAVNGPLTHCFQALGTSGKFIDCYADTPTNYGDPSITTVYGFHLHSNGCAIMGGRVFHNTSASVDISTDNVIAAVHVDRDVSVTISDLYISGGNATTRRFKSLVTGFTRLMRCTGINFIPANYADRTTFPVQSRADPTSVAELPTVAREGDILYVADGDAGAACAALWDGLGWRKLTLGDAPAHNPVWTWNKSAASAGGYTFARASAGALLDLDADGDLDTTSTDVERLYTAGTLKNYTALSGLRKNWWINSDWSGGVAGSPGTVPTGLTLTSSGSGLTRTLAYGTESDGLPYMDITFQGTASAAVTITLSTTSSANYPATVNGDVWTMSQILRLTAGSVANLTVTNRFIQRTSADASVGSTTTPASPYTVTSADSQPGYTFTMNGGGTVAKLDGGFRISVPINNVTDFTIRVRGMALMQQAFVSAGIIRTSGTPVQVEAETLTRALVAADVAAGTIVADWYNTAATPFLCRASYIYHYIDSGTARLALRRNPGASGSEYDKVQLVMGNNVVLASFVPDVGDNRTTVTWGAAGYAMANNGTLIGSGATYTAPSGSTVETIGGEADVTGGVNAAPNRLVKQVRRYPGKVTSSVATTLSVPS